MKFGPTVLGVLTALLASSFVQAQALLPDYCSTSEPVQFPSTHRASSVLGGDQVREAILVVLGSSDVDVSWARDTFAGQWFYEYQDESVIFAGYSVRSHYLQVAILVETDRVTTIVCDSRNLKQSEKKIHKKVPGWKGTLDDNIRIAMGQAAEYYRQNPVSETGDSVASQMGHLNALRDEGLLSDDEYQDLKRRVLGQ